MNKQPPDLADRQASKYQRELLTCRHFNGVYGPGMTSHPCKAGVDYRAHVGGDDFGWLTALPCLPREVGKTYQRDVVPCDLREFPSVSEVEAEEARIDELVSATTAAINLCRSDAKGARGVTGAIECPVCSGRLRYSVSSYNGHLHGKCETEECLTWVE